MSHPGPLLAALITGLVLGLFVFAGLWWTLRHGLASPHPALWFGLSSLVRLAVVLTTFYYVALVGLPQVVLCLLGVLVARLAVTRVLRSTTVSQPCD